jgi:hypothetical protein
MPRSRPLKRHIPFILKSQAKKKKGQEIIRYTIGDEAKIHTATGE